MSAAERYEDELGGHYDETTGNALSAAPDVIEIRRNAGVAALVGVLASGVAIAYLARAAQTGAVLDWVLFGVMTVIGAAYLHAFLDARTPLLLADAQGVRLRLGRAWRGLPWGALADVQHTPRRGLFRDGRLVLHPHNTERVLSELDASGRRQSRLSEKMYGAPFALPLGLSTRVTGATEDLTTALRQLAGDATRITETAPRHVEPEPAESAASAESAHDVPGHGPVESPAIAEEASSAEDVAEVVTQTVAEEHEVEVEEHTPLLHDPRPSLAAVISRLATRTFSRPERDEVEDERGRALEQDEQDEADELTRPTRLSSSPRPGSSPAPPRRRCARPPAPSAPRCVPTYPPRTTPRSARAASSVAPAASTWSRTPRSGGTGSARSPVPATPWTRWSSTTSRSSRPPTRWSVPSWSRPAPGWA